jgi:hypothetical protein
MGIQGVKSVVVERVGSVPRPEFQAVATTPPSPALLVKKSPQIGPCVLERLQMTGSITIFIPHTVPGRLGSVHDWGPWNVQLLWEMNWSTLLSVITGLTSKIQRLGGSARSPPSASLMVYV